MRLEYLQYFCEVCRTKSMSTAGRDLHVAQQTVSMAIKSLEEELGVTLLERTNRGVRATPSGECYAQLQNGKCDQLSIISIPNFLPQHQRTRLILKIF